MHFKLKSCIFVGVEKKNVTGGGSMTSSWQNCWMKSQLYTADFKKQNKNGSKYLVKNVVKKSKEEPKYLKQ